MSEIAWKLASEAVKSPFTFAVLFGTATAWLLFDRRKIAAQMALQNEKIASLEGLILGVAFYQKEVDTDRIVMATPQLAAILGISVNDIVGKPIHKVFDRNIVATLRDLDLRLTRNEEVVESNVSINGAAYTIAKRKIFSNNTYWLLAHIHRQDVKVA